MTTSATATDRVTHPSLITPSSHEEARLAVIEAARRHLTGQSDFSPLARPFAIFEGPGLTAGRTRTAEQARWLNEARESVLSKFTYVLDQMRDDIDEDEIRAHR